MAKWVSAFNQTRRANVKTTMGSLGNPSILNLIFHWQGGKTYLSAVAHLSTEQVFRKLLSISLWHTVSASVCATLSRTTSRQHHCFGSLSFTAGYPPTGHNNMITCTIWFDVIHQLYHMGKSKHTDECMLNFPYRNFYQWKKQLWKSWSLSPLQQCKTVLHQTNSFSWMKQRQC